MAGVGDAVALIAQPIAKASDSLLKTNIAQCMACERRRVFLNELPRRVMAWVRQFWNH